MKILLRYGSLWITSALLFCLQSGVFYPVFGQVKIGDELSEKERQLLKQLEQDNSILQAGCKMNRMNARDCSEGNRIKLSLYQAARSGKAAVKAKTFTRTKEGDKVVIYLIVERGKIRLISDYSRDQTSPPRVLTTNCAGLTLAYYEKRDNGEWKLKQIADEEIKAVENKDSLVLLCREQGRDNIESSRRFQ